MFKDLVRRSRSVRRFHEGAAIPRDVLLELVDCARLTPSGANLQPLKYILSCDPATNAAIFPTLAWAAYLQDWTGPAEGERPSAYIVILGDTAISRSVECEQGIAAQTILLAAAEIGLGGCMIATIQKDVLRRVCGISSRYAIQLVLALGRPKETITLEVVGPDGDVRYWRDDEGGHHVPKRTLEEIVIE